MTETCSENWKNAEKATLIKHNNNGSRQLIKLLSALIYAQNVLFAAILDAGDVWDQIGIRTYAIETAANSSRTITKKCKL